MSELVRWGPRAIAGFVALAAGLLLAPSAAHGQEQVEPREHRLTYGDKIALTVFGEKELTGEFAIDQTGNLRLPLGGDVVAVGLTVSALQSKIAERLAQGYLKRPIVNVNVSRLSDIYVTGMVRSPGAHPYRPGMNVGAAIALAGGMGLPESRQGSLLAELLQTQERVRVLESGYAATLLKRERILAQLDGKPGFSMPLAPDPSIQSEVMRLFAGEQQILASEQAGMRKELEFLRGQVPRIDLEIAAIQAQRKLEERQRALHQQQLDDYEKLMTSGLGRKPAYIDIKREEARLESNMARLQADHLRADLSKGDVEYKIEELQNRYRRRLIGELQEAERAIVEFNVTLPSARDIRDARTTQLGVLTSLDIARPNVTVTRLNSQNSTILVEAGLAEPLLPGDIVQVGQVFAGQDHSTPGVSQSRPALVTKRGDAQ